VLLREVGFFQETIWKYMFVFYYLVAPEIQNMYGLTREVDIDGSGQKRGAIIVLHSKIFAVLMLKGLTDHHYFILK
jgi:hypothetical protein